MMVITPDGSETFKQSKSTKIQNLPSFDFDEKERAYKLKIESDIHVLINECPGKKREL